MHARQLPPNFVSVGCEQAWTIRACVAYRSGPGISVVIESGSLIHSTGMMPYLLGISALGGEGDG